MKEYVVGAWDVRKQKLYDDDSCPSQLQSLAGDLKLAGVEGQTNGKLCFFCEGGTDGCVVDGSNAMRRKLEPNVMLCN